MNVYRYDATEAPPSECSCINLINNMLKRIDTFYRHPPMSDSLSEHLFTQAQSQCISLIHHFTVDRVGINNLLCRLLLMLMKCALT